MQPTTWLLFITAVQGSQVAWWNIQLAQEQGPNVCATEDAVGSKHRIWTECKYWHSRDICGVKPLLKYECCEGFKRIPDTSGCLGVTSLENVLKTAKQLGGGQFVRYVEKTDLLQALQFEGPFTLFVPTDEAFKMLPKEQLTNLESGNADYIKSLLEYHIVEGRVTSSQFKANLLIPTKNSSNKLKINKYSNRIETVNCALLQRKDQQASNGVVHIISDVLEPLSSDLIELMIQDGRFRQLSELLSKSGLMEKLRSTEQFFTILAPSDEAFAKIKPSRLTNIVADTLALQELLENHILPYSLCAPAIIEKTEVHTLGPNVFSLDCDGNGLKVENTRIYTKFSMASNGLIYVVDDVLVPNRAKSIVQIMEEEKTRTFLQIVRFAGLEVSLENFGEYTVFVPSDAAMTLLPEETVRTLKTNKEMARNFILYHTIQGRLGKDKFINNQKLTTLSGGRQLRVQVYRSGMLHSEGPQITVSVEGAIVQLPDLMCLNGVIHVINMAVFPTNYTAVELVRQYGNFKIFLKGMDQWFADRRNDQMENVKTYFVPNDVGFHKMDRHLFEQILSNPEAMNKLLQNHMSTSMVLSQALQPGLQYSVPSYHNILHVSIDDNQMKVNTIDVLERDILTTNGQYD